MFDTNTTFTIGLRTAAGKADVTVRWPTDAEWDAHRRRTRLVQTQLGRGATATEIESGEADAKLYEVIKLNGAPPLTVAEAGKVVDTIALRDVIDVRLGDADAEVEIRTPLGQVKHLVGIPTMDQVKAMQKTAKHITFPYSWVEIRSNLDSAAALWDQCGGRAEGYAGAVPNLHKDVAIRAVINAVDLETAPKNDEANF